jgi:hypothetical protein
LQANGHCHWYVGGKCTVHENAPYGCAFFDAHRAPSDLERRSEAGSQAIQADIARNGLYAQVWQHLCDRGLTRPSGNRAALNEEARLIRLSMEER